MFVSIGLLARQIIGWYSLRWLIRNSQPIKTGPSADDFAWLRDRFVTRKVKLRQTNLIQTAATIGWLHPVILLPRDHTTWSRAERRAAIGHELAHVQQGDFAWRLIASLYAAANYFNPLAHCRRLTLEQELMADRIASQVLGRRRAYARSLSRLAMRVDDTRSMAMYTGLLSVTSTNLLRRVEMLRAKDGSQSSRREKQFASLGVALMVLVTIVATGLRVSAENVPLVSAVNKTKEEAPQSRTFDLRELRGLEQGAFVIRPSLLVSDEMGALGRLIRQQWQQLTNELDCPAIDLTKIKTVAGGIQVSVNHIGKTLEPDDEGIDEHNMKFGTKLVLIRLHESQDLVSLLMELFPKAESV